MNNHTVAIQSVNNIHCAVIMNLIKYNQNRLDILDEEDEIDNQVCVAIQSIANSFSMQGERSVWRHPSSNDWWENIYPNLNEELFVAHFRVDRETFSWIVNAVKDEMTTHDTTYRNATPVDKKVAVSLKCLATTCDMLTIASLFGIGKSSAHKYFLQFVNVFYDKIVPKVIKFPGADEFATLASDFENTWGFPMAFSAIDGTHIPFNPPMSLATDFHNYKGWSSIMAIAMCDARGKCIWLKSGMPGRMSDSGAFKMTKCYERLSNGSLIPPSTRRIGNVDIPFTVLGDSGFAMEKWLLKPFTYHGTLTENQKNFNYRHSRARRSVENMFGRVKMRWRRLLRGLDVKYENAHKVICTAFALHNICETNGIIFNLSHDEANDNREYENRYPQPSSVSAGDESSGAVVRDALMNFFVTQNNPWTG